MKKFSRIATAVATVTLVSLPAGALLAQNTSNTGAETITAAPPTPPAAAPARPAATTLPPPAATPAPTNTESAKGPKKKKIAKMTRQREIDKSIDSGTVPSRYRRSVPREYQQYVPFEKQ